MWHVTLRDRGGNVTTGRIGGKDRSDAARNAKWAFPGKTVISLVRIG